MKNYFIKRAVLALFVLTTIICTAYSGSGFIENIGQVTDQYQKSRPDIIAKLRPDNGLTVFLSNKGIHYQFTTDIELYRMDVELVGANPNPRISKQKFTGYKEQYRLAYVSGTAGSFGKIIYHDIYPFIDWVFYINDQGKLEHDFVVRPGGKVSDIQLIYQGADQLKIDRQGNLNFSSKYGSIREPAPYSYEQSTGKKVKSSFFLNGNLLTFKTGSFLGTLVIDPVIDWSTYLGGSEYDEIRDVKVGKDGFVYVVGSTNSTSNIATSGAHLVSFQGGSNSSGADAFISKFTANGTNVWSTYFGGPNVDLALSLAIDSTGHLFIAGRTNSTTGISTTGSHQPVKAGNLSGYDAFLLKMDTSGIPLWSTYYGGAGSEGTQSIALTTDRDGNAYLAGNTNSPSGIATPGSHQVTKLASDDGFIAKFGNQGNLIWGTYYGSASMDQIHGIASDTLGNIIIVGQTSGTTGLSTTNAFLQVGNGGTDAFLAKFSPTGQRIWGTYYGGNGLDVLYTITTDSTNAIYCSGITNSAASIATPGAYQTAIGGPVEYDACIAKFNTDGTLNWSTYFGGTEAENSYSIAFANNILYFSGNSTSSNNIATPDGIKPVFDNSTSEGVFATFSSSGQRLYATYLGGDAIDNFRSIALSQSGNVYLGGSTFSLTGLSTTGSHQTTFNGDRDGWLMKLKMCNLPPTPTQIVGNIDVCADSDQQYYIPLSPGTDSVVWLLPMNWTGSSTSDTIQVIVGNADGEIKAIVWNNCGASDTVSLAVTVKPSPQPIINRNGSILSVSQTFNTYQWYLGANPINGATNPTYIALENGIYSLQVQGENGCYGISNELSIEDLVSVNNLLDLNNIYIYPNPFGSDIMLNSPIEVNLQIVDVTGKIMLTKKRIAPGSTLDLSILPNGNYYFKISDYKSGHYLGTVFMVKIK